MNEGHIRYKIKDLENGTIVCLFVKEGEAFEYRDHLNECHHGNDRIERRRYIVLDEIDCIKEKIIDEVNEFVIRRVNEARIEFHRYFELNNRKDTSLHLQKIIDQQNKMDSKINHFLSTSRATLIDSMEKEIFSGFVSRLEKLEKKALSRHHNK